MPSGGSTSLALLPDRPLGKARPASRADASETTAQPGFRAWGLGCLGFPRAWTPSCNKLDPGSATSGSLAGSQGMPGMALGSAPCADTRGASAPESGVAMPFSSTPPRWWTSTCTMAAVSSPADRAVLAHAGWPLQWGRQAQLSAHRPYIVHLAACKALAGQVRVALAGAPGRTSAGGGGQALGGSPRHPDLHAHALHLQHATVRVWGQGRVSFARQAAALRQGRAGQWHTAAGHVRLAGRRQVPGRMPGWLHQAGRGCSGQGAAAGPQVGSPQPVRAGRRAHLVGALPGERVRDRQVCQLRPCTWCSAASRPSWMLQPCDHRT